MQLIFGKIFFTKKSNLEQNTVVVLHIRVNIAELSGEYARLKVYENTHPGVWFDLVSRSKIAQS